MSDAVYQLIIRKGPKPGQIYPLAASIITIGRDPMSDITLNDPEVSRYHAQIAETNDNYQIQDMGSTNGTYINGQRIGDDPVDLMPGTEITFGSGVVLLFDKVGSDDDPFTATLVDTSHEFGEMAESVEAIEFQASDPPPPPSPEYNSDDFDNFDSFDSFDNFDSVDNAEPAPSVVPDMPSGGKKKRTSTIVIAIILILLLCCCGFGAFMWFYGGDWLVREFGLTAMAPIAQFVMA